MGEERTRDTPMTAGETRNQGNGYCVPGTRDDRGDMTRFPPPPGIGIVSRELAHHETHERQLFRGARFVLFVAFVVEALLERLPSHPSWFAGNLVMRPPYLPAPFAIRGPLGTYRAARKPCFIGSGFAITHPRKLACAMAGSDPEAAATTDPGRDQGTARCWWPCRGWRTGMADRRQPKSAPEASSPCPQQSPPWPPPPPCPPHPRRRTPCG